MQHEVSKLHILASPISKYSYREEVDLFSVVIDSGPGEQMFIDYDSRGITNSSEGAKCLASDPLCTPHERKDSFWQHEL